MQSPARFAADFKVSSPTMYAHDVDSTSIHNIETTSFF